MTQAHTCHARGCKTAVPPVLLMCRRHWFMVPSRIQRAVYRHYRVGQCDDKEVTAEWLRAATAAVGYVARIEGLGYSQSEAEAMRSFGLLLDENVYRRRRASS